MSPPRLGEGLNSSDTYSVYIHIVNGIALNPIRSNITCLGLQIAFHSTTTQQAHQPGKLHCTSHQTIWGNTLS